MGKKRNGKNINCKVCGNEFYVPHYRIHTAKFCSINCQNHKQYERYKFTCLQCKKKCEDSPSRKGKKKFCSRECKSEFEIDRVSCIKEKRRISIEKARKKGTVGNSGPALRKWILGIKEKKCEVCGFDDYESCLDIHHKDNDPNHNSLENLKVLCVLCHRKVHRKIINL